MNRGEPGMGKSHILLQLTKPKYMPMWLHRWNSRHNIIDASKVDLSDIMMPSLTAVKEKEDD
jgi:hypothetical protein